MVTTTNQAKTLPDPSPLAGHEPGFEWEYNGDFWEIGYHDRGENWIVLASLHSGTIDRDGDDTWKVLHEVGTMMAASKRMLMVLQMVKTMMDTDPDSFSLDERVEVNGAILAATKDAEYWTRDDEPAP